MAISTAYKSGTVGSVSGSTFTRLTGDDFVTGDVGRLVVLTSGNGRLQHRKIVSRSSNTEVIVDHPWDETPWLDTVQDVNPSLGDNYVVSYLQSDAAFTGEAGVTVSGEQIDISALELTGDAYVHITNSQIDLASAGIEVGEGAGIIFGWYHYIQDQDGQVKDSCHIIDSSTGTGGNQWGRGTSPGSDFGMLDIYGGVVQVSHGGTAPFWRCYNDSSDKGVCQCRWINLQTFGSPGLGSRIDGSRSIIITEQVGAATTVGVSNPRAAVSRVSITAIDCDQAAYVWLSTSAGGPSGRIIFPRLDTINGKIIRVATSGHSDTNIMEVIGKKAEIDQSSVFLSVDNNPSGTHTFRYGNLVAPQLIDDSNTLVTDNVECVLLDVSSSIVDQRSVTTGLYDDLFVRHTDIPTTKGNKTLTDGATYSPYSLNCATYTKQLVSQQLLIEDKFDSSLVFLNDQIITELDKTITDAYTDISTPYMFYDRAKAHLVDNYSGRTTTIVSRSETTVNAGNYNVVIDPNAVSAFDVLGSTITIKTQIFVGNITTTGTITLLNGASIDGIYTDTSGTYVPVTVSVTDIQTNLPVEGAQVFIAADDGGPLAVNTSILNNTTDVNGEVTVTYVYSSEQPIKGRARKSTSDPYYKTTSLSGTITATGYSVSLFLLRD